MTVRFYSSVAQQSTLTASITPSTTTIQLASTTGLPGSTPFTLSLDYGSANEELVDVTSVAGLSLTVTRAVDGTSASSHNAGAIVRHVSSARDFAESRAHENATANVHGVVGAGNDLVGTLSTQTLSNKTLNRATGTLQNVDIFNVGLWRTTVIGDSTNLGQNRFAILRDEISLGTMAQFTGNGALYSVKQAADVDGTYRFRLTESDQTTDRWALLAGGTMTITPNAATGFPAVDVTAPDLSTAKRAFRVAASGGGTERFAVFNDGHTIIQGQNTGQAVFDVQGPASHAASYTRVRDSAGNVLDAVTSSGRVNSNANLDIRNNFDTSGVSAVVLRVFGRNPGQTGALTQWVDAGNVIRASVDANGNFNAASLTTPGTLSVTGTSTLGVVNAGALTVSGTVLAENGFTTAGSASTSGVITASTGWSVSSVHAINRFGMTTIAANINRTGANIVAGSDGDIADVDMGTIQAAWLPNAFLASELMSFSMTNGFLQGSIRVNASTGVITLTALSSSSTLQNGTNCRITFTYHS